MVACASCGSENAETAKFCSECGAPLAVAIPARREERKVVSVVFVDLVGSTARAETSDPEDVRALLRVYHERAREQLESFGGTVEKFIGDAVVAVFGAPVAHEDDPERAVRAALGVREAVAELNEAEPGRDLHVRVAVNTGEALVSLDAAPGEGEGMVAGDVVNTAARLQSAAPIDGILVGEQTYRATERAIVYRQHEPIVAKGKSEPLVVWEALEPRSRLGVDLGGQGRAQLVGRDEELAVLVGALARARRERSTQFVTLVGVPGIGKSRLLFELGRAADEDEELITWRQGRSLPYGEGVSYWALGEIVKAQAGIYESDDAEDASGKLALAVRHAVRDESESSWVERHLAPLVGLGEAATAGDRRGEAFAAWRRCLEAVAEEGPTVLVFEDVHWADDGLLDFVDGLVDWVDGVPLLVVCTARPELLERRPEWGGGKRNSTTVSLGPLDHEETTRLLGALLERPVLDADVHAALVERAAGNPLYAEEFVRMLQAGGTVDGRLPETVQGIVAARIDLLPGVEKEVLQRAAVLGKVFWADALASFAGSESWELAVILRSLERKEFVRREHRSAVAGATQHSFVHALVRDAAYAQLPRTVRADLHVAAASWIESLPADRSEDRAETLAHHYVTAVELLEAAGRDAAELHEPAGRALQEAGERALALSAYPAAARFLRRALELVPPGTESPELLLAAGQAFGFIGEEGDELARALAAFEARGDVDRAAEAAVLASWVGWHASGVDSASWLRRARSLVESRPASRAKALVVAEEARRAMIAYRYEAAIATAGEAVSLAREIGDEQIEGDALVTRGVARVSSGDPGGVEELRRALELVGHRGRVASRGYVNLGVALATNGDLREAGRVFADGLERAEREGDEQGGWFARGNLVGNCYSTGSWDEALRHVEAFRRAPEGARYMEPAARDIGLRIAVARGDPPAAAVEAMRTVVEQSRELGDEQTLWPSLLTLASLAERAGRPDEHRVLVDEVGRAILAHESVGDPQEWHVELMLALRDAGQEATALAIAARVPEGPWRAACEAAARGAYVEAADVLETTGERPTQALLRARAARALLEEGRIGESDVQLERARAFWRSVGATAYLGDAGKNAAAAS